VIGDYWRYPSYKQDADHSAVARLSPGGALGGAQGSTASPADNKGMNKNARLRFGKGRAEAAWLASRDRPR
jgi:hypothetical protein